MGIYFRFGAVLSIFLIFVGCSGGGSSSSSGGSSGGSAATLSGVVAVGTPIVGSSISVVCAAGSKLTTTSASDGTWSVTISGQTFPCAAEATGGTINSVANTTSYHSVTTASGTMNITPLTELLVATTTGSAPSTWFAGLSSSATPLTSVTLTTLSIALNSLSISFSGLTKLGATNPINTAFTPTSGNVSDDMLTALATAIANTGVTYASLLNNMANNTAIPAGMNSQLSTAYASTASGSNTSSSGSSSTLVGTQMGGARQGVQLSLTTSVSTVAGSLFNFNGDGLGTSAGFSSPTGITTDGVSLFVADSADNQIRKISLSNFNVTTIGGGGSGYNSACCSLNFAKPGALDGIGVASSFSSPKWITTDGTYLYVTDTGNNKIRKIVIATNEVSTLTTSATFSGLQGITTDGTNLYVVDNSGIRMVVIATGTVSTISLVNATGGSVSLTSTDITTDGVNLFVTDSVGYGSIHKIVISSGVTTLLAGNPSATRCQDNNGTGTSASFCNPRGITTDGTYLYVAGNDSMASGANNAEIRKVVISTGQVTTLAGGGAQWDTDAVGTLAGFRDLFGITTNGVSLFAVDNTKIREIQ